VTVTFKRIGEHDVQKLGGKTFEVLAISIKYRRGFMIERNSKQEWYWDFCFEAFT
jgi:hypothetical protein